MVVTAFRISTMAVLVASMLSTTAFALDVGNLNTFKNGDKTNADDVNANFTKLKDAVDSLNAQLAYGRTATNPGRSCRDIKAVVPSSADGVYMIDPDATGPIGTLRVRCDMTRDGGGWTYILKNRSGSGMAGRDGSFGSVDDLHNHQTDFYKLSDAAINAIISDGNFDILADQVGYNAGWSTGNHEYVIVRNYTATFSFTAPVPESTTLTVFESFRSANSELNWRGRLGCGDINGGVGINCATVLELTSATPVGAANPQGGGGCLAAPPLGTPRIDFHEFVMSRTNTDTYLYICNGAQHSSGQDMSHQWWVR